jgi:acyl-CoA thioesterase-1
MALPLVLAACSSPDGVGPFAGARPGAESSPRPAATPSVRYVAIGASDTVGVGANDPARGSWPARLAAKLPTGAAYTNLGVSGALTGEARIEQLPRAIEARPTLVTVWLAVNDLNAGIDPQTYGRDLGAIVGRLVAETESRVFIGTVPDLRPVPIYQGLDPELLIAGVHAYNAAIAQVASRHPGRAFVVDLFSGSAELVSNMTVSPDGFHPSDAGYALIADRFAETMRSRGVPLR